MIAIALLKHFVQELIELTLASLATPAAVILKRNRAPRRRPGAR